MEQVAPPNVVAVFVMAIIYMIIGYIWYSKPLFGDIWAHCGVNGEKTKKCESTPGRYIGCFILAFIMAYVLAHFINVSQATTALAGLKVALCAWVGFILTAQLTGLIWCRMSAKLFYVVGGFKLVNFVIWGLCLGAWH
jgi:hypothetical protein